MSKPNAAGELRDVDVLKVSLVNKAANKRQFKIFKSADYVEDPEEEKQEQEPKGLVDVIKNAVVSAVSAFFKKEDVTQPPTFTQAMAKVNIEDEPWRVFSTLREVCTAIMASDAENKAALCSQAIDEFKTYFMGRIAQIGITKAAEELQKIEVEKAGRKISAARLKALQEAYTILGQIISEAENTDEEGTEVKKEEIVKVVGGAVTEALKPITQRLEKLENETVQKNGQDEDPKGDEITAIVKAAVEEAIKPINDRLEKVEKARGISNAIPNDSAPTDIKKDEVFDWGGVFTGGLSLYDEEE